MIKQTIPLSIILALRFFSLFVVLPMFSLYALQKDGVNEILIGISIGGYALTQMIFQVPFGILSDKIGRKTTIIIGLIIFAIGSILCAVSSDIYTLIFGRFLQGVGAIGAVVTAMISDLVVEEIRAKAMAVMGGSIAISFALAMMAGPIIGAKYGIDTIFWITAIVSIVSIVFVFKTKNPPKISHDYDTKVSLSNILKDKNILIMNITNFLQKGIMTMTFVIIPIVLTKDFGWDKSELFMVFIPATILGILAMGPASVLTEKKAKAKEILIIGIVLFAISYILFGIKPNDTVFVIAVILFFIGFNIHEPIMQSLTSKLAKIHQRGAVLGVFNSFGYAGTFVGGIIGSFALVLDFSMVSILFFVLCIVWIVLIAKMENPAYNKNIYIKNDNIDINKLKDIQGIIEYYNNIDENMMIIKYNSKLIDEKSIKNILGL